MKRSRISDWNVTMHWPRAVIYYCWVIIGTFMSPIVDYFIFGLSMVAAFFYLQVTSYALDELKGRHCGTKIPSRHLWFRVWLGLIVACIIGIYLVITVSLWLILLLSIGVYFVIAYNYEVLGGHSRIIFAIVWGMFPIVSHFILQAMELPTLEVWAISCFALIFSYMHIISYGHYRCRVDTCRDSEPLKDCHGQMCNVRRYNIGRNTHRLAKKITDLHTWMIVVLAVFVVVMHYGNSV